MYEKNKKQKSCGTFHEMMTSYKLLTVYRLRFYLDIASDMVDFTDVFEIFCLSEDVNPYSTKSPRYIAPL